MGVTPVYNFPYPETTDSPHSPNQVKALAEAVEADLQATNAALTAMFPLMAFVAADVSKVSSTAMSDVTGLSFPLAANSKYALDGAVSYYGLDGVDMDLAFTGPSGMTVSWGGLGQYAGETTEVGTVNWTSLETYGDAAGFRVNTETSTALVCRPWGYWQTGGTAGTLQLRFAQAVSNATALSIKRGSWLRLTKLA